MVDTSLLAGSTFEFTVDEGTTYTELLGIQEWPDFKVESEEVENTSVHDTTKQYRDGMDSPQEQTLTCFYIKADADQLVFRTLARAGGACGLRMTYSDGDSIEVPVKLKNYGINGGDATTQKMWSCVLRRTAQPTYTESTS